MNRLLNLVRAAQLVGVPRATLQRMIRSGELQANDGFIDIDELRRAFPDGVFEDSGVLERVARIRDDAFGRRLRERLLPSQEVLAQRLLAQGQELADLRRCTQGYHALLVSLQGQVHERAHTDPAWTALATQIDMGLKQILGAEPAGPLDAMADALHVIAAQVTLRPSGRTFLVEGNDSILQAGLKAGARFAYGCGSGTCGLCKARVVSGETRQIGAADYPLSAQEREQGYRLLCAHTALGDLVVETLEAAGPGDVPAQQLDVKVRAVTALDAATLLLHLQTARSSRLRFLAGQAVTLGACIEGVDAALTLPLASCPCDERNLHLHVSRSDASPLAQALFAGQLRSGATVNVRGPVGDFVLPEPSERPLLMLACDTGFAPVKSLIESALAAEAVDAIDLFWLATREGGHYLENQCRAWAAALDLFRYHPSIDADPARGGRVIAAQLLSSPEGCREREIFVAGNPAFVDAVAGVLTVGGVAADVLHTLVC
jgi:CDP-4-dehydro-6-deoxyglucose reductase